MAEMWAKTLPTVFIILWEPSCYAARLEIGGVSRRTRQKRSASISCYLVAFSSIKKLKEVNEHERYAHHTSSYAIHMISSLNLPTCGLEYQTDKPGELECLGANRPARLSGMEQREISRVWAQISG